MDLLIEGLEQAANLFDGDVDIGERAGHLFGHLFSDFGLLAQCCQPVGGAIPVIVQVQLGDSTQECRSSSARHADQRESLTVPSPLGVGSRRPGTLNMDVKIPLSGL